MRPFFADGGVFRYHVGPFTDRSGRATCAAARIRPPSHPSVAPCMLPLVALVGRPNVGKSTLFNALTRSRDALVHDQPGVTRDRNYGVCRLDADVPFLVVDTGGIAGEEEGLAGATARQARAAAEEADLVLFIVDGREGPSALDDEILAWLRKTARPTLLVINKIDGINESTALADFARYGFSDVTTISASHRQGIDDLLTEVHARLPEEGASEAMDEDPARMRVSFTRSLVPMTNRVSRGCEPATSSARRMPFGVSIIAHTAIDLGAPAASSWATTLATSAAVSTFGTSTASAPDLAMAAMSALPHGVDRPLQRIAISRLP